MPILSEDIWCLSIQTCISCKQMSSIILDKRCELKVSRLTDYYIYRGFMYNVYIYNVYIVFVLLIIRIGEMHVSMFRHYTFHKNHFDLTQTKLLTKRKKLNFSSSSTWITFKLLPSSIHLTRFCWHRTTRTLFLKMKNWNC